MVLGLHLGSSSSWLPMGTTGGGILASTESETSGRFGRDWHCSGRSSVESFGYYGRISLKWTDVLASVGSIMSEIG